MFNRQTIYKFFLSIFSIILLLFGTIGIITYNDNPVLAQAILSLALLSLGLFYKKNIIHFVQAYGHPKIAKIIPWVFLIVAALIMILLEIGYWKGNKGTLFLVPLYMAALAIGLYLANITFYLNENQ